MSSPQEREVPQISLFAEVALSPEASAHIAELAVNLSGGVYHDSFSDRGQFIAETQSLEDVLIASSTSRPLEGLKDGSLVAVKITGLPVDPELPPPPLDGGFPDGKKTFVSEGLAIAVANILGYPSMILGEKKEALVHQITPIPGKETSQSNEGQVDLRFHQDLAPNPDLPNMPYFTAMPDWLILTGVQAGTKETRTYIAAIEEAVQHLSPEALEVLRQKRFVTNPPDSFLKAMPDAAKRLPVHAVLFENNGHIESAFDRSSDVRPAEGLDDYEATASLAELEAALTRVKREISIEPGTQVIFNNRRVVHGRSAIGAEENLARRRWIQRVYVYDTERLAHQAMGIPGRVLQLGGGIVRLASSSEPSERMMELADQ